jgi:hypothetical protein
MWNIGYTPCPEGPVDRAACASHATERDGDFVRHFAAEQARAEYPLDCNGRSTVFGERCFDRAPLDQTLVVAGEAPGVFVGALDLRMLRAYRAQEVWGDAYGKPCVYEALAEDSRAPIFQHEDSRRTGARS